MKFKRIIGLIICFAFVFSLPFPVAVSAASNPTVTVDSLNLTPYEDSFGEIKLKVIGGKNVSYQWQAGFFSDGTCVDLDDNNVYKGTKTNHFKLFASGYLWQLDFRCKITYDGGTTYSQVFHFTFIERSVLRNAYVYDLIDPSFAKAPDFNLNVSATSNYAVDKVVWIGPAKGTALPLMNSSDIFVAGGYCCRVYLKPSVEYKFDESSTMRLYIDRETSDYSKTASISKTESGEYYSEFLFTIDEPTDNELGLLAFEWKTPSENKVNVNLGNIYLGTASMDIPFEFKIKALPRGMASAGYYTYGSTYIKFDGQDKSLYYAHSGDKVNLKDIATTTGRYHIFHEIFLVNPNGEEILTESVHYITKVLEPVYINDVAVEVDEPKAGVYAEIALLDNTIGCSTTNMYWYDVTGGNRILLDDNDVFEKGHTYQVLLKTQAREGYFFNTDTNGYLNINATINDKPANILTNQSSDKEVFFTLDYVLPLTGDVNGDGVVNISDATEIQKYAVGRAEFTDAQLLSGDVNKDGVVNISDATDIQKYAVGKLVF